MSPIVVESSSTPGAYAQEGLVLDGLDLNDLTNYRVEGLTLPFGKKRYEWAQGGDADGAALIRDPLCDNGEGSIRIRVDGADTVEEALAKVRAVGQKLEECEKQDDGLELVHTAGGRGGGSSESLTFYVLSGEIEGVPITAEGEDAGYWFAFPVFTVKLYAKPFGYGDEVTLDAVSSSLPLLTLTVADVPGDVPAEARLIVTDTAAQSRRFVEWGLEQRHYAPATSLLLDSDNLVTSGFAGAQTTRTGAYDVGGGDTVVRATLTTSPVAVCGLGNLGHVGHFLERFRIYASSADVKVRLAYREGDGPLQALPFVTPPASGVFTEVDLGFVTIPEALLGTQRWTGQIEAYSDTPGDTIDVDFGLHVPAGEGYGKVNTPPAFETPTAFSARDEFDQSAGNLNAKTAPVGGVWATSGSATDYVVETAGHTAQISATVSERYAISGLAAMTAQVVQVDFKASSWEFPSAGVIARWTDSTHYARAYVGLGRLVFQTLGASVIVVDTPVDPAVATWYSIRALITSRGEYLVWFWRTAELPSAPLLVGQTSQLATGGELASGKVGLYEGHPGGTASTRNFDNFFAAVPTDDAVIFSGQSAEFRTDGFYREDSTGTYYGRKAVRGSDFLLPEAGDADRTSRIAVLARRNDIEEMESANVTDALQVAVAYRPRFLTPR